MLTTEFTSQEHPSPARQTARPVQTRTLIVDDHAFLRIGLRMMLESLPQIEIVGETATGCAAIRLAAAFDAQLIFLDVHLPDLNGIEVARRILKEAPQVKIIIFTSDHGKDLVAESLETGIAGYLSKSSLPDQVAVAVESVLQGKLYISPELSSEILSDYKSHLTGKLPAITTSRLSELDRQMMRFIAEGLGNKEMSENLNMTPKAVEAYRARLMKRLGFAKSAELIRFALREGIAKP